MTLPDPRLAYAEAIAACARTLRCEPALDACMAVLRAVLLSGIGPADPRYRAAKLALDWLREAEQAESPDYRAQAAHWALGRVELLADRVAAA
jgi:hypothetical protein